LSAASNARAGGAGNGFWIWLGVIWIGYASIWLLAITLLRAAWKHRSGK
jgi:hypothetical protein